MSIDLNPAQNEPQPATSTHDRGETAEPARRDIDYKWIALANTTLGVFMAAADTSIVVIAMPAIFQDIQVNPLAPAETHYFLWLLLGYMMVTATLLVSCGRISDLFGRVRLYNLGFAVYVLGSLLLTLTPGTRNTAALQLILYRLI